jgi:HK97 family phage major capsid protein
MSKENEVIDNKDKLFDLKKVEGALMEKFDGVQTAIEKANAEIKLSGDASVETKATIDKLTEDYNGLYDRIHNIEQNGVVSKDEDAPYDLGAEFIKSDQFKDVQEGRAGRARMEVKTAIINATGASQPLVAADRLAGFNTTPNRNLSIRDVLPSSATSSNLIEFVRENVFTNNAGPQVSGSPEAFENVTKPESAITFTLVSEAVQTLAHFIPASKQVIEDSASLQSFINGRLMYGLKLKEETQLLLGSGSNGELNGINTQATAYTVQSPQLTNEIDIIREMIKQANVAEYAPDTIVMNPQDWYDIDVRKVGSSDDRYVVGNPREMGIPRLWGLPVVVTNSLTSGTAIVGSFAMGAEIKDRTSASVEISLEDSTNFQKNMVTIRAEERIALCVYRTEAFITGSV